MPMVLNLRGRNGFIPTGAVYVGRKMSRGRWNLPASKWANPFVMGRDAKTHEEIVAKYRAWLQQQPELMAALPELRDKDLACWCVPSWRCHAEVLLELANR